MDKSRNKNVLFLDGMICFLKWLRRSLFIMIAAFIIGFSNAFNNESKSVSDVRNFEQQEQTIPEEDFKE